MPPTPKVLLKDNETRSVTFTMKRSADNYHCTCPSWIISARRISGRSCDHLKELLGEEYEEWRLDVTGLNGKKRKAVDAEDEDNDATEKDGKKEGEDDAAKKHAAAKGKGKAKVDAVALKGKQVAIMVARKKAKLSEDEVEEKDDDGDEEAEEEAPAPKRSRTTKSSTTSTTTTSSRPVHAVATAATSKPADLSQYTSNPLLAHKYEPGPTISIQGWFASEKLDGVRAIWTGTKFISREGNPFCAPAWFTKRLPTDVVLDGELFTKRGGFQDCVSIVRTQDAPNRWKFSVSYQVFDVPSKGHLPLEKRLAFLKNLIEVKLRIKWVNLVKHFPVRDDAHIQEVLDEVTSEGGEGLMLREPGSLYVHGRSRTLLKVKKFFDADAIVRGYNPGSGKNCNVVGALWCEMLDAKTNKPNGTIFKVGSGLTDAQRAKPPKIGAIIIFKYQELSKSGNPRFPTYGGERAD
ncbi:hypothetical protein BGX38DRAFT_1247919 [Terfezia claveryi]|nr:hypothetical protein BGX38DRAFT_1247919 [Terfezia claveryi]